MAHASASWACGRHPSTFNQYIEYGPVAVVANDGDTNNEGRSATDNDVEIGDGRLRILPWYGKHTALFAIHHPTRRVHLSSSSHTHPVTVYNSHSLHLQMYSDSLTWSRGTRKGSGCFTWILACNGAQSSTCVKLRLDPHRYRRCSRHQRRTHHCDVRSRRLGWEPTLSCTCAAGVSERSR